MALVLYKNLDGEGVVALYINRSSYNLRIVDVTVTHLEPVVTGVGEYSNSEDVQISLADPRYLAGVNMFVLDHVWCSIVFFSF